MIIVLILHLVSGCYGGQAQSPVRPERFRLFSDRPVYVAGETVRVSALNLTEDPEQPSGLSKLFYLELISSDGLSLRQSKVPLKVSGACGTLEIPVDLPSGTYYLKGYTRWMRNFGPECYAYLGIRIVNPYRYEILPARTAEPGTDTGRWEMEGSGNPILVSGIPVHIPVRSKVSLTPSLRPGSGNVRGCVSVTRKELPGSQYEPLPFSAPPTVDRFGHMPETRGPSLSGRVVRSESGEPAPYAKVYVTVMDDSREFYCNYADSSGRFFFAFPAQSGEKELFISASLKNAPSLEINIVQDFCTEPVGLPSLPLRLEESAQRLLGEMAANAQINQHYLSTSSGTRTSGDPVLTDGKTGKFFYGEPLSVVDFEDFIRLPSLEEYFTELIPKVAIRKIQGTSSFRILGPHPDLAFHDPLVMVDGVAVFDHEAVLKISPRLVDRVEIVHVPYIKGNLTFGGIMHVITRDRNLGFMDLPESGLLIEYQMVRSSGEQTEITDAPEDPRRYDARNTLYWDPGISLKEGSEESIEFFTGDTRGPYRLLFRGYTENGSYFRQEWEFQVR